MIRQVPIKRKVTAAITLASVIVVVLTIAAFMISDLVTFRQNLARNLATLGQVVAENSTAALAFKSERDARDILNSLHAQPQINAAAIYDADGKLFVTYPETLPPADFPSHPLKNGPRLDRERLVVFYPISRGGTSLGWLYLKADLSDFYARFRIDTVLAALIMAGSLGVAMLLSDQLQKRISGPILALANTARIIYDRRDYSVRAPEASNDELGVLTAAFNQMLTRIEEQTIALRESKERLRLALEASRTGAWDWDLKTNRITWDDFLFELYGLKPGEFDGTYQRAISLIQPEDQPLVENAIQRALDEKKPFTAEFRVTWPDGSIHYLFSRGRAFYDNANRPVRLTGVSQDITERKNAERARAFLAAIVDSTEDAIIGKDLTGRVVSWNAGATRMFGYTAAEMVGKPIDYIVSPDRPYEEQQILEQVRLGNTRQYETVRLRKDGKRLHISLSVSPIRGPGGEIMGVSSISRDITERIRVQEALARQAHILHEQSQMLDLANVMARDLEDRIILWNTGMEKMYGWLRTETLGRVSHEVLQTRFQRPLPEIRAQLMREGQWEGELVHTRKDGRSMVVASQWVVHKDVEGRPVAILEINTDITGRKQAEEQILRMNTELEQHVRERTAELTAANSELEAFTYSVAHDLRAPLRHIDAFSRILAEDFAEILPQDARRYLDIIRKGSQNMSQLVDDLLNLARVGRQELKRQHTPLNPLVDEVIAELRRETEHRNVEWHVGPLTSIQGDPGLMKQVFANLLSNAVKYTRPRPKAVIEIGQKLVKQQPVIYVRDNGVGFNMKYADKLFGVFQRLHRAEEFEGTGVGLAIVDRVIRRHGGRIWAESAPGNGATFYFTVDGIGQRPQTQLA